MHRDDLLNHTLRWVYGYCWCYNMAHQQFDANSHQFHDWMHRVHNTIWRYLHGKQTLDASCSDLECTMALEARALFGPLINKDKEARAIEEMERMYEQMQHARALEDHDPITGRN